jgi:hypothetical protein
VPGATSWIPSQEGEWLTTHIRKIIKRISIKIQKTIIIIVSLLIEKTDPIVSQMNLVHTHTHTHTHPTPLLSKIHFTHVVFYVLTLFDTFLYMVNTSFVTAGMYLKSVNHMITESCKMGQK